MAKKVNGVFAKVAPKPVKVNESLIHDIATALQAASQSMAESTRVLDGLRQSYAENPKEFFECFKPSLNQLLVVYKEDRDTQRCVDFVAKFAVQPCQDNEMRDVFINQLLSYLLTRSEAKDKAVRFRVCQVIGAVLTCLPEDAELSDELFESLRQTILIRIKDKTPNVRVQAVAALARLQDPDNSDDPLMHEFIRVLTTDTVKEVRSAVLHWIGVTKKTVPVILSRIRDNCPQVRCQAMTVLRVKVPFVSLSISNRISIIKYGLQDRENSVVQACTELVSRWLSDKGGNILDLLKCLDVEQHAEEMTSLMDCLFSLPPATYSNTPLPPYSLSNDNSSDDILTSEAALYWASLCNKYQKNREHAALDDCLPDTIAFCVGMEKTKHNSFITRQLLTMTQHVDTADENGRRALCSLLQELLVDIAVDGELVSPILNALRSIYVQGGDAQGITQLTIETISDVHDMLEAAEEEAGEGEGSESVVALQAQLQELQEQKQASLVKQDYAGAAMAKKATDKLTAELAPLLAKDGAQREHSDACWLRLLQLAAYLFENTKCRLSQTECQSLLQSTLLPAIRKGSSLVREKAFAVLGMYCLMDKTVAKAHVALFVNVLQHDQLQVQLSAMRALFDMMMSFPGLLPSCKSAAVKEEATDSGQQEEVAVASTLYMTDLVGMLAKYLSLNTSLPGSDLQDEEKVAAAKLRQTAVEGMVKLMILDRFSDPVVLSSLVLMSMDPSTAHDFSLRQCLAVFFPAYAASSVALQDDTPLFSMTTSENGEIEERKQSRPLSHRASLLAAMPLCFRSLSQAKKNTSMSEIKSEQVAQFIVMLLAEASPTKLREQDQRKQAQPQQEGAAGGEESAEFKQVCLDVHYQSYQEQLALLMCFYLLASPTSPEAKAQAFVLSQLHLNPENQLTSRQLYKLLVDISQLETLDKAANKLVEKTLSSLETQLRESGIVAVKEGSVHHSIVDEYNKVLAQLEKTSRAHLHRLLNQEIASEHMASFQPANTRVHAREDEDNGNGILVEEKMVVDKGEASAEKEAKKTKQSALPLPKVSNKTATAQSIDELFESEASDDDLENQEEKEEVLPEKTTVVAKKAKANTKKEKAVAATAARPSRAAATAASVRMAKIAAEEKLGDSKTAALDALLDSSADEEEAKAPEEEEVENEENTAAVSNVVKKTAVGKATKATKATKAAKAASVSEEAPKRAGRTTRATRA